jgi:E3 ubiquitin-protein ligase UBR1
MSRTVAYALDFVLDTLDYSPDDATPPHDEHELRTQPTAEPVSKEYFAVLLWNDDKHSFEEVIHNVSDATGCSREVASDIVYRIDDEVCAAFVPCFTVNGGAFQGRDIIEMSDNVMRLLDIGTSLNQIDLGVTIRRAFDTFREQVAAVIIEWLLDLTRCKLGTDTLILREIISAELLSPRKKDSSSLTSNQEATKVYNEVDNPARLDWLFLYHTRLWKKPRLNLKQIYVSILTLSHDHKIAVGTLLFLFYLPNAPLIDVQLLISPASTIVLSIHIC